MSTLDRVTMINVLHKELATTADLQPVKIARTAVLLLELKPV